MPTNNRDNRIAVQYSLPNLLNKIVTRMESSSSSHTSKPLAWRCFAKLLAQVLSRCLWETKTFIALPVPLVRRDSAPQFRDISIENIQGDDIPLSERYWDICSFVKLGYCQTKQDNNDGNASQPSSTYFKPHVGAL